MKEPTLHKVKLITHAGPEPAEKMVVEEYALRLKINGNELATLICSPHQLNFMIVGFMRLQGFIDSLNDLLSMGICSEHGLAELRIKAELPTRLQPTLTSGCGTGISFNLPESFLKSSPPSSRYHSGDLARLMKQMNEQTELYHCHGGIHSSAIGVSSGLLLTAEDIGRHNTLDRLAGEALFRQINLRDKVLLTSGRISTEMVAKAARLGIGLIASRTSPTDKAIELCEQVGICLVGYLRGRKMEIYSHPQQVQLSRNR